MTCCAVKKMFRAEQKQPTTAGQEEDSAGCPATASSPRRIFRWLRSIVPALLWTVYLVLGALIFSIVEAPAAAERRANQENISSEANKTVTMLFQSLLDNVDEVLNDTKQEELLADLAEALAIMASLVKPDDTAWAYMDSLQFCFTVVSTIGYGFLAPRTQLGRSLCILYALIGIPLNLFVMASAGKALARGMWYVHRSIKNLLAKHTSSLTIAKRKNDSDPPTPSKNTKRKDPARYAQDPIDLRTLSSADRVYTAWEVSREDPVPSENYGTGGTDALPTVSEEEAAPSGALPDADAIIHDPSFPAWIFVLLVCLYTCGMAGVLTLTQQNWTFLDGLYYIIVTITTIGFGDLVVTGGSTEDNKGFVNSFLIPCLALAISVLGMVLLSAGISIAVNKFGKSTMAIQNAVCGDSSTTTKT